MKGNKNNKRY